MTRVQRERFTDLEEYERVKDVYVLTNAMLSDSRPNLRVLHPLPRVGEMPMMWMTIPKPTLSGKH